MVLSGKKGATRTFVGASSTPISKKRRSKGGGAGLLMRLHLAEMNQLISGLLPFSAWQDVFPHAALRLCACATSFVMLKPHVAVGFCFLLLFFFFKTFLWCRVKDG